MESKYLELHPFDEWPTKDDTYDLFDAKSGVITNGVPWYKKEGWGFEARYHTHWLSNEPVTGVLVSEEELRKAVDYLAAFKPDCAPSLQPMLENLINSLTNKAK